jgi:L-ascorbate metabolism protein UlaG (beta-lactamase superfamily)
MNLTLVRHAALLVETGGARLLVDPMLDPAGARPAIEATPEPRRNPLVGTRGELRHATGERVLVREDGQTYREIR